MSSTRSDTPFLIAYLLVLVFQLPVWLCAGLLWGVFMIAVAGFGPVNALVGGLGWGFLMWLSVGNLAAVGLAWRRSASLPAADREAFRAALARTSRKLRFVILGESPDELVLGPKWALVRFRLQQIRVEFKGREAILTAPALSFGRVMKALGRALAQQPAGRGSIE